MLNNSDTTRNYLILVLLHVALGVLIYTFGGISKFLFFGIFVYFLIWVFISGNKKDEVLIAAGYIMGYEVFSRMTGGALTYEFAKYAVILFLLIGMFFKGFNRKSGAYIFYLLCLVPGILFSAMNLDYSTNVANAVGFNLSGPVCLGISALYCYNRKMPFSRIQRIFLAVLLPIITTTTYLYLYTPDLKDVITNTESNFATSGGFGPNQVATVLGLGAFILFTRFFTVKNRIINVIDLLLIGMLGYRAIITFSRGGVFTALLCAFAFIVIYMIYTAKRNKIASFSKIGLIIGIIAVSWIASSINTQGFIDKRYSNQDAAGREEEDLSTGRLDLLNTELEAFYTNPFTGIGIGKAKEFRMERMGGKVTASHNEVSRLLSEHGIFGILALFILIIAPLVFRIRSRSNIFFYSCLIFWFLTINHSSMRIAAPAFIYGLSLINVINGKKKTPLPGK
ncbi:MAG: O-antigen ligase family protein [Bacteroidia bacterium]|nr:O-antigen ligase family protein [Bacteroidia bacterium]MBT8276133.1 O-antigen ligase family protein [Bacteroidia bacterium]NNF32457.1 O-antigen ligase family protein [Flavobacteriaceae bacterium]NNJ82849.1 O-antigen ligase family protein [Flavobacteriaceae bacterium]NNM08426.1 O-antigen ligase family protein [Flavobacteriaceae bacterium]